MPLQKQVVTLNLSGGLDTKTSKKHVMPGKLTKLENGVYEKNMQIVKRKGFVSIPTLDTDANTLQSGSEILTFKDELLLFNDSILYGYVEQPERWVSKGQTLNTSVVSKQVINNQATQTDCDCVVFNGIGVYGWEDSRGGAKYTVVDDNSFSTVIADAFLNATGRNVRCLASNPFVFLFHIVSSDNTLRAVRVNTRVPTEAITFTFAAGLDATNPFYEVILVGDKIFIVYNDNTGNVSSAWFDADGTSINFNPLFSLRNYSFGDIDSCCCLVLDQDDNIIMYYHNSAADIRKATFNQYGVFQSDVLVSSSFATVENIAAIAAENPVTNIFKIYFTVPGASSDTYTVRTITDTNGSFSSPSVLFRSVGLYTKPFEFIDTNNNRLICLGVTHESDLQSTYFVLSEDGTPLAKQQYTTGGGLRTASRNLATVTNTANIYSYALLKKNRIVSENALIFTPTGVMGTKIDFTSVNRFNGKEIGNNFIITGGIVNMYDGQSIVEHGFLLYPENVTASAVGSGGSLADGSYQIFLVYEWTDNFGQIHRSRPSVAETVTCSAGGTDSITVTAPTLRLTRKNGDNRTNVSIVGYVTEANGSVPYRFTSISTPILNDMTVDTVSLGTITSVSISNEILYTTGSVLPNDPAPSCSVIEVFQNRVWLGGLEESNSVYFSKENKANAPVEFSDEFTKTISSGGGRITSLSFVDDKLLAFKVDRFFITYGDGPNDTNTLGGFSEFENVSIDVGCDNQRSIAKLPSGIVIKTQKGVYRIDSTLNAQYVGAPVEEFNNLTMTSANLLAGRNEVFMTHQDGNALIYNYYYDRWSSAVFLEASGATIWKNQFVLLKTSGTILAQNENIYKDADASYGIVLESGWISLGNLSSYKRIYQLLFFGDYKSKHKIRVKIAYDNNEAWEHVGVYDPTSEFPVEFYGDDSPYGESGTVYGGDQIDYCIRVNMKRQKCSSFRFRFEELTESATTGTHEGLTISDVGILVGLKKGVVKKPQSRNLGVS